MRVSIVAHELASLGPLRVAELASETWRRRRPSDVLEVSVCSYGRPSRKDSECDTDLTDLTGLTAIFRAAYAVNTSAQGQPFSMRDVYLLDGRYRAVIASSGRAFLDLSVDALSIGSDHSFSAVNKHGSEVERDPELKHGLELESSAFLVDVIDELRQAGGQQIHLHLPQLPRWADAGRGFLGRFADDLTRSWSLAREYLDGVLATFADASPLVGLSGVARQLADLGLDAYDAQDLEKHNSRFVSSVTAIQDHSIHRSLLNRGTSDARSAYAGVGGGIGFLWHSLGVRILPVGQYVLREIDISGDLVLFIGDSFGATIPSSFDLVTTRCEMAGIPLVFLTSSSDMRRGELPRLGIHGVYALDAQGTTAEQLAHSVERIAVTWGWD